MATPSVRLLAAAVWALLDAHPHVPYYKSLVDAPPLDATSGRLSKGYGVFHPGGGDDGWDNLAATPGRLLWAFQVSCVGEDHDQIGWVIDETRELLTGKSLTVAGHVVGRMQPPLGYQAPPPRPEHQAQPARLLVPLQYQVLAAA